jgi:hypothetical protein
VITASPAERARTKGGVLRGPTPYRGCVMPVFEQVAGRPSKTPTPGQLGGATPQSGRKSQSVDVVTCRVPEPSAFIVKMSAYPSGPLGT